MQEILSKSKNSLVVNIVFLFSILTTLAYFPETAQPFTLTKLFTASLGLFIISLYLFKSPNRFQKSGLIWITSFVYLLGYLCIAITHPRDLEVLLLGASSRLDGLLFTFICLLYFLALILKSDTLILEKLINSFFYLGILMMLYGFTQLLGSDFLIQREESKLQDSRVILMLGNSNFSSILLVFTSISTLNFIIFNLTKYTKKILIFIIMAFCLQGFLIHYINTLQGIITFWFGVLLSIFFEAMRRKLLRVTILFISSLALIILTTLVALGFNKIGLLTNVIYGTSLQDRFNIWRAAIQIFMDKPITGTGLDTFGEWFPMYRNFIAPNSEIADNAHNYYLQYASTGGIILLSVNIILLVVVLYYIYLGFRIHNFSNIYFNGSVVLLSIFELQSLISLSNISLSLWGWVIKGAIIGFVLSTYIHRNGHLVPRHNKFSHFISKISKSFTLLIIAISLTQFIWISQTFSQNIKFHQTFNKVKSSTDSQNFKMNLDQLINTTNTLKSLRPKELLAVALIKNGYYVESVQLLQDAIRLYPRSANQQYMLGLVYIELQNYDLGKKYLLEAKNLDPLNLLYKKAYFELIESK